MESIVVVSRLIFAAAAPFTSVVSTRTVSVSTLSSASDALMASDTNDIGASAITKRMTKSSIKIADFLFTVQKYNKIGELQNSPFTFLFYLPLLLILRIEPAHH